LTGLWPIVHLRSFEAVTGPKVDDWLVRTVGLLAASIGISLGAGVFRGQTHGAIGTLALTSALSFAAIDLWYGLSGRIPPIYLIDAVLQMTVIALLILTGQERDRSQ
jgi:hypothetical protein